MTAEEADPVRLRGRRGMAVRTLVALSIVLGLAIISEKVLHWVDLLAVGGRVVSVSEVQPENGRAYIGRLSDSSLSSDKKPSPALLYLVETHRGGPFDRLQSHVGESYLLRYLAALWLGRFPYDTYETWVALGPGNALHDDIRQRGGGRYSIWNGYVYFSPPEGTDVGRGSRVVVVVPVLDPNVVAAVRGGLDAAIACISGLLALGTAGLMLGWLVRRSVIAQNIVPGVVISCVLVLVLALGGEWYLRETTPFTKSEVYWPTRLDGVAGVLFVPGAEVRWTNGLDFWSVQRANSLGFLDREPVIPKPADTFRIALVGDSFVEAAQLPIEQKLQTILGNILRDRVDIQKFDVVALGYSGTGQANQLGFFERYKEALQPDLVILIFVQNDFSNNSRVLESIRNAWDPDHLPRPFVEPDGKGGVRRFPIDPGWAKYSLPGGTILGRLDHWRQTSDFYKAQFAGWDWQQADIDSEFYQNDPLPPAFIQALASTHAAFAEFKRHAEEDGFRLMVVAADNVANGPYGDDRDHNQIRRLRTILDDLQIPLLDLYPEFVKRGGPAKTHWAHDAHWNATGHQWAAEAIFDTLASQRLIAPMTKATEMLPPGNR
jgi:hypothetical protein